MASLFTKTLNSEEFKAIVNESSQTTDAIIDNIEISNFEFPVKSIKNIYFTNSEWNHITLTDQHYLENVVFENCVINNSDFTGVNLTNVRFVKCRIHNVIFNKSRFDKITFDNSEIDSTDTNIERSYREMIGDEVHFNNSKITGINFFHSTMKTYFNNSELYDIKALGLKEGSLLSIIDSKAKLIDFSRSTFDTLTVKNSTIKESKANNCRIGSVVLEDSDLKFPIADGKGYDSVIARNTKNVIIGGTPVKEVSITDCGKSDDIDVAGITFDKIIISDCDPLNFTFHDSKGKFMSVSNMETVEFALEDIDIDNLVLENIYIRSRLLYENAKANNLKTKNISFKETIKIKSEGAKIEIKPDTIKPAN